MRLRKALGADAIETSAQGYRLVVPADEVDFHRFEQMVARSRELLALGEPERAAYLLTQALDLWRGRAFEDVESWDLAIIEAGRLDELRLEAEELRVDASLRAGRHLEVLAAAESMVQGRADAGTTLDAARRWRSTRPGGRPRRCARSIGSSRCSRTRLGLDPGPELASLEEAILRQDDSLLADGADSDERARVPTKV